ncbi:DHS-like NAD/FAD-binding domain-containing protein [Zalerion maritima]|uniref:DHS-like NAD/FAD-binding domain-containing protein n=1 Tax=Zalerion maritima TaxID=339359 RepID=A0AAD5WW51_9PEZI|nr:DHS-like NAD/FAD-binding domain-containing protein [Zalerion maritima]
MRKPVIRIPYRDIISPGVTIPSTATTLPRAVEALHNFFISPPPLGLPPSAAVLSGAGISVSSGLADYRGVNGTYRVNKTYRPIYYHEFVANHEARKRYWARSFLGWTSLANSKPNFGHYAVKQLGDLGLVGGVITQNVDSFHHHAHPNIHTLELHGYLRALVCTSCREQLPRDTFQQELSRLNPAWADFLAEAIESGSLDTANSAERNVKGIRSNPDGDVDLPQAPYSTFRYPACPRCFARPPLLEDGKKAIVAVDSDGAWTPPSTAGVLKPAVVMFGENIAAKVKEDAEHIIDNTGRLLILGTSLATYSAWRLAKRAKDRGMPVAVINLGGIRGEDMLFEDISPNQTGAEGVRVEMSTDVLLPALVESIRKNSSPGSEVETYTAGLAFKEMLS